MLDSAARHSVGQASTQNPHSAQIWTGTSRLGIESPGSVRIPAGRNHPGSTGFSHGTRGILAARDRLIARRRSRHAGFPLDSHINTQTRISQVPAAPGIGIETDIDVWNCISPSNLFADPRGSPRLTGPDNDVDLFACGFSSHMIIDRQESSSPETNYQTTVTTPDIFGDLAFSVIDPDFSTTHSSALDWIPPSGSSTGGSGNPTPPDCCLTAILELLARLFPNPAHGCTLTTGNTLPTSFHHNGRAIESVISENKQVIETLTSILECHCSHDEYLLSLMTLVTLKVMGWYVAAAAAAASSTSHHNDGGSTTPPTPSPSTSPPPSYSHSHFHTQNNSHLHTQNHTLFTPPAPTPTSPHTALAAPDALGEHVLPTPTHATTTAATATSVGAYCLAGPSTATTTTTTTPSGPRLVLGELHGVGRLAQALAQRLEGVRVRAGAGAGYGGLVGFGDGGGGGGGEYGSGGVDVGGSGGGGLGREPPLSVSTLFQLEEDLRRRMGVLMREVVGRVGGC
ncbi:aflatoxin regulatory protein-domain-containing protein [Chaetomium fimeti]|uniref:Aflatoxin regulatory protein-domain-containing protein n=1 Tax=Chaetomium fimeti TaxID=1854472 RepID=A0AAE0H6Z7_9PEZI|nr:aflatoxin regulatory protein-domain-containing protein [Chaetomium fimeti]